jgi:hypothetical protein
MRVHSATAGKRCLQICCYNPEVGHVTRVYVSQWSVIAAAQSWHSQLGAWCARLSLFVLHACRIPRDKLPEILYLPSTQASWMGIATRHCDYNCLADLCIYFAPFTSILPTRACFDGQVIIPTKHSQRNCLIERHTQKGITLITLYIYSCGIVYMLVCSLLLLADTEKRVTQTKNKQHVMHLANVLLAEIKFWIVRYKDTHLYANVVPMEMVALHTCACSPVSSIGFGIDSTHTLCVPCHFLGFHSEARQATWNCISS